jgi:hypothetical protein
MVKKIITVIGLCIIISSCSQKYINIDILQPNEREITIPDGSTYTWSQSRLQDERGPLVTISLNKPPNATELPYKNVEDILISISIEECGASNRKPSVENMISSSNPSMHRYKHNGIDRVAWSYTFYCIQ